MSRRSSVCPRTALSDEPPSPPPLIPCLVLLRCLFVCMFVELVNGHVEDAGVQVGARAAAAGGDADSGGTAGR